MRNTMGLTRKFGHRLLSATVLVLVCTLSLHAWAAPKTDVIVFKNGDRLTGEIKSLKRGRLNFNTDATGTIAIEWDKIASIKSNQYIQVETQEGVRHFGQLIEVDEGQGVYVGTEYGPQALDHMEVTMMSPIETGRPLEALDIDVLLGYNFAKAGGVEQGTFGVDVAYRTQKRIYAISLNTTVNDSNEQEESRRSNIGIDYRRLWSKRRYVQGNIGFERNDELGLDLRTSIGASGGRYFIQSNTMLLDLQAGLQYSREKLFDDPEKVDSVEAMFGAGWDWFLFDSPELDWSTHLHVFPNLSDWGRVRADFDTSLKWEMVSDLKWGFTFYSIFDNKDTDENSSSNDYGVNSNITYEF